ncbi:ParB N-terminal domain-containing protein [Pseudomonas yamanorum]|uniref:ParB N-terminal domain-containing protein n=1 Tax=Pseudomonas yamanorum TaxID=515393 RepID=UPI003BA17E48
MNYETWESASISPNSIDLDPNNPRLPGLPANASEAQIREELFSTSKVKEMMKSISKSGFFPDQRVVVVRKPNGRGFIVIEGNRRICACQVLLDPDLAPERHQRAARKWANTASVFSASFVKVPVVIAPSRLAATQLLSSRHLNDAPVIRWSRYAQGRFAINAFADGQDLLEVMEETGMSEADLKQSIQEARMFDLFFGLSWSPEEKEIITSDVDTFPIEALRRILRSSATSKKFGDINFDANGWITFNWEPELIQPLLKRLVYDALPALSGNKKAELNSRTLNDIKGVEKYLEGLPKEILPNPSEQKTSAKDIVPDAATGNVPPPTPLKIKAPRISTRKAPALPADIELKLKNDKALALLQELQTIIPENFSYATALLLRTLLEITLIARIKKVGQWTHCISKYGTGGALPTLEKILKYAEQCELTIPDSNLRKSLSHQGVAPRVLLNLVAHNDQLAFTPSEARDTATKLTPLLRELLEA